MNLDAKNILAVIKSNIVITICVVVIIGALVGLPYISSGFEEEVTAGVDKKNKIYTDLKRIRDGKITIPGASQVKAVVNKSIIDKIQDVANVRKDQSQSVLDEAQSTNRGMHDNLDGRLFPGRDLPLHELPIEAPRFQKRIVEEYKTLLEDLNAGMPPSLDTVLKDLQDAQQRFLDHNLRKSSAQGLEPEEVEMVKAELSDRRRGLYISEAEDTGIYLDLEMLSPPTYNNRQTYTLSDMFRWQWRFWVVEEVLDRFKVVNGDKASVLKAPIKRVLSFKVRNLMAFDDVGSDTPSSQSGGDYSAPPVGPSSGPASGPAPGFASGPAPGSGGAKSRNTGPPRGSKPRDSVPPRGTTPVDFVVAQVPAAGETNFDLSVTGRISNALYDVVLVDVSLVVAKDQLADTLQTLVSGRFLSVRNLSVERADAYDSLKLGYLYGDSPVVKVDLTIETVWLRSWTSPFMPQQVRADLGMQPIKETASAEDGDDDS